MFNLAFQSEEARSALAQARPGFSGIAVLSFVIGLFPVATLLFALLIFDVAIPGRSGSTLVGLMLLYIAIIAIIFTLSSLRRRMLAHISDIATAAILPRIDDATSQMSQTSPNGDGLQATRDLDLLQSFFRSRTAAGWIDVAAFPIALIAMFFIHPWIALWMLLSGVVLMIFLWRSAKSIERPLHDMVSVAARRQTISESGRANRDVLHALGMKGRAIQAWTFINQSLGQLHHALYNTHLRWELLARNGLLISIAVTLVIGAWLTITDRASPATTMAAAFLLWMALEPLVRSIEDLPLSLAAHQGWNRLDTILSTIKPPAATLALPTPNTNLECENIAVFAPGMRRPLVHGINFSLSAGDVLGVIGPAGCGKSALLRGLGGIWPLAAGKVRLDGAAIDQWDAENLAAHIGYLPQSIDLIDGTIAENIARFIPDASPDSVVDAATDAQAHDLIVRLPEGYNTRVGPNGRRLSVSQAQRIALARAFYGNPFLILIDEPTAHLDTVGMRAFADAVHKARERGAIVIIAGNANNFVGLANQVLVMKDGAMTEFGEREAVRQRITERRKQVEIGVVRSENPDTTKEAAQTDSKDEQGAESDDAESTDKQSKADGAD